MTSTPEYETYLDTLQEIIDLQRDGNIPESLNLISANIQDYADKPELYLLTAVCSYRQNALGQAIELCEKAHAIDPENQEVVDSLAVLKTVTGNLHDGLYYAKLATTLMPHRDIPDLLPVEFSNFFQALNEAAPSRHYLDGLYQFNGRQFENAITEFEAELQINPNNLAALKMLGHAQLFDGRPEDTINNLSRYFEKFPDDAEVIALSAMAQCMRADFDAARDLCKQAIEMAPGSIEILMQVLEAAKYFEGDLAAYYDDVISILNKTVAEAAEDCKPPANKASRNPDAPITIGMISNDLRAGDQYAFLMPLVEHIDNKAFNLTIYQQSPTGDSVFQEFKSRAPHWRRIVDMDDDVLALILSRQRTDMLIDLCGFSSNGRSVVFAAKAAPVITNMFCEPYGFRAPGSNVIIADAQTLESDQKNLGEGQQIVVTEGHLFAVRPPTLMGAVKPLPALENDAITFGAICKPQHFTPSTVTFWSRILQQVEGSKLILGNVANIPANTRARVRALFTESGIAERIEFLEEAITKGASAEFYNSIDIFLDSTPVNGTVALCHALWMGVPVITLKSTRRSGLVGTCILSAAGKPEWIAENVDQAVQIASELASNTDTLSTIRETLREDVKASALMDTQDYAMKMMAALKQAVEQNAG